MDANNGAAGSSGSSGRCRGAACIRAVGIPVVTVSTAVAGVPFTDTDDGEKLHAAPAGSPEHANVTIPLKPLLDVSVTVDVADAPAATEPDVGASAIAKSGFAAVTVRLTAPDVDAANAALPLYCAVKDRSPTGSNVVDIVAVPCGVRAALPTALVPFRKLTVPAGVPPAIALTVAVSVTD